jgi:outer membrane protein assembly factor BamB
MSSGLEDALGSMRRVAWTALAVAFSLPARASEWTQFAGPFRNFTSSVTGLLAEWPASGPPELWARDLGEGYSGVVADGPAVYTMYRKEPREVVVALDAATGKTLWEHAYDAPIDSSLKMENGPGPHATPVVVGEQVCTAGILARLICFDKKSGRVNWSRDLYKDFPNSSRMGRGYSCNPLPYRGTLILTLGGEGSAVVSLRQQDGTLVWGSLDHANAPSSPLLINAFGQEQVVVFLNERGSGPVGLIVGVDPGNGKRLWEHPHKTDWGLNISLPVWGADNLLFLSSAYGGGSRMLELRKQGASTEVKELWSSRRMRVHHTSIVRIGDTLYASSGDFGPAPLTAVSARSGEVLWQDRAFSKANFVSADGKLIVLDEDGNLALARVSPERLSVVSRTQLLARNAWTAPSLAGTRLYIRDRRKVMALELAATSR